MSAIQQRSVLYAQNFLKSRHLVDQLLDRCNIGLNDIVYEIGPGKGIITERLARHCRQVIAIEKDPQLVAALRSKFAGIGNIRLHEGDFSAVLPASRSLQSVCQYSFQYYKRDRDPLNGGGCSAR